MFAPNQIFGVECFTRNSSFISPFTPRNRIDNWMWKRRAMDRYQEVTYFHSWGKLFSRNGFFCRNSKTLQKKSFHRNLPYQENQWQPKEVGGICSFDFTGLSQGEIVVDQWKQLLYVEKHMKYVLTNSRNEKQQSETNQYDLSLWLFSDHKSF